MKSEKSNKNDRGFSVVPAPTTGAVPLQLVGAEITRLLRALEITAYQSPKAYSEQEVDMAPAAPIKPGKPVAEWDAAAKPEQHRRILVVGMGLAV